LSPKKLNQKNKQSVITSDDGNKKDASKNKRKIETQQINSNKKQKVAPQKKEKTAVVQDKHTEDANEDSEISSSEVRDEEMATDSPDEVEGCEETQDYSELQKKITTTNDGSKV